MGPVQTAQWGQFRPSFPAAMGQSRSGMMTAPPSGFNLIECADLDEAIEVSPKHPVARYGVIELRPIANA